MEKIITRFPPSPTGYLHVGGARTAIFNWLYARHMQGKFVLRIEDTDRVRYRPETIAAIMDGVRWLAIDNNQYVLTPNASYDAAVGASSVVPQPAIARIASAYRLQFGVRFRF